MFNARFGGGEIWTGESVLGLMEGAVGQLQHAQMQGWAEKPPVAPKTQTLPSSTWRATRRAGVYGKSTVIVRKSKGRKKKGGGYFFFFFSLRRRRIDLALAKKKSKKSGWWGGSRLPNRYCVRYHWYIAKGTYIEVRTACYAHEGTIARRSKYVK